MSEEKIYAEVDKSNKILATHEDVEVVKKLADYGNRIVELHEVPLGSGNSKLAQAYAEKSPHGYILAIWNEKSYVDDSLEKGSQTILLQEDEK
ncbi:hypothetical protein OIU41_06610 [Lacticaseibacillus paracasei]|uniref:hypothetical protein n=1 Tax=Lacticaseibacillus paracasei TaxID=1597 RepID=UPI003392F15E